MKNGVLNIYSHKLTIEESNLINTSIKKLMDKVPISCYLNTSLYNMIPHIRYLTSSELNFKKLKLPSYQIVSTGRGDYENKACVELKTLVDYIFSFN